MAKTTAVAKTVTLNEVATIAGNTDFNNPQDLAGLMNAAKFVENSELQMLTGSYQELKDGETYIFVVTGIVEKAMKSLKEGATDDDLVDAVGLINEAQEETINVDVVMVSTVRKLIGRGMTPPFLIKVFVDGQKGSKGREYKNLQIWGYNAKK